MLKRLARIRESITHNHLDALLVNNPANVFYMTGFADFVDNAAAAIITGDNCYILVDPRYTTEAKDKTRYAQVVEYSTQPLGNAIAELVNKIGPKRIGYESDFITVSFYRQLRKDIDRNIELRSTKKIVDIVRRNKDAVEIETIRKASAISDAAFDHVTKEIHTGMTEKEVAILIDFTLRKLGADKEAFETIAAAGPDSACPHWQPSDSVLQTGQFFKMDFGARLNNYNSDITRTVCLGQPDSKQKEIYRIVLDAQLKALDAIAPGRTGKEIDSVARDYIASQGYGNNFGHGLGHGLGILVHDGPGFSRFSDIVLEPGMVITVEPGIYIEGWGGVRIEDDIVVIETGFDNLTSATKDLIIIES